MSSQFRNFRKGTFDVTANYLEVEGSLSEMRHLIAHNDCSPIFIKYLGAYAVHNLNLTSCTSVHIKEKEDRTPAKLAIFLGALCKLIKALGKTARVTIHPS